MAEKEKCNIKVVVKIRPLLAKELDERLPRHWTLDPHGRGICNPSCDAPPYNFDDVFDEQNGTQQLYDRFARPIVVATLNGINGTIFAYGQTASGKTYTIMGNKTSPGIIPLAVHDIFKFIQSKSDRDFLIRVSFIEIYNEKIKDLLDPNNTEVKIREDCYGSISMTCKEKFTTSPEQVLDIMHQGNQGRSVGETIMNEKSSRSHSIFQIIIESRKHVSPGTESDDIVNVSQLNLVDLAGSERAWQAGTTKSFREGCHINKSLTTLSLVIRQLSTAGENNGFINYRDSKLTRILQSSLGGNAKTGIICTVTPTSLEETQSTLKFAMCAKTVQNKPRINTVISDATQLKILSKQLETYRKELESKKNLEEYNMQLEQKIAKLSAQILTGIGDREVVKRNPNNRRQTWWGQQLKTIEEHDPPPSSKNENSSNFKKERFRLSNLTERNESNLSIRDSITSNMGNFSFEKNMQRFSDDVVLLDTSDDATENVNIGLCSPTHHCYDVKRTPPCVLRDRARAAQKELKELEEMTSLEKQLGSGVTEYVKEAKDLKIRLQESTVELDSHKNNILNLNTQIEILTKDNKESENIKLQLNKQISDLKCENEGLLYQLETSKKVHKDREKELLASLEDARKSSDFDKSQTNIPVRMSQIPILLSENRKKDCITENDSTQQLAQAQKELQKQIRTNESFNRKVEELDYKLCMSNDQLRELSEKNSNLLQKINELKIDLESKNSSIVQYEEQIDASKMSITDLLANKMLKSNINPGVFIEVVNLMTEYLCAYEKVEEKEQMCNGLTEKVINLENLHNELITKVELLSRNILKLCPILDIDSESLQLNETFNDMSLADSLNNITNGIEMLYGLINDKNNDCTKKSLLQNTTEIVEISTNTSVLKSDESQTENLPVDGDLFNLNSSSHITKEINENRNLLESIKYLEGIVSNFEKDLMKISTNSKTDVSFDVKSNTICLPIFDKLCTKFENIEHLHQSLLNKTEKRFMSLEEKNSKLLDENQSLKLEIQNGLRSIRELILESELLHKKVLCQRNEQQMVNAEFSLMTSHLTATNHYHNCLHATCDSTFSYIKKQLLQLQTCLQNSSISKDVTDLMDISYNDMFSESETTLKSHILGDDNVHNNSLCIGKRLFDEHNEKLTEAYSLIESKTSETSHLLEEIKKLQEKITILEKENIPNNVNPLEKQEFNDYEGQLKKVNLLLESNVSENKCLNQQINELHNEITAIKKESVLGDNKFVSQQELHDYEEKLQNLNVLLEIKISENTSLHENNQDLLEKITKLKKKYGEILLQKQEFDDIKEKLEKSNVLLESKFSENKCLNEKIQELNDKISTVENDIILNNNDSVIQQEFDNCKENLEKTNLILESKITENICLREKVEELQEKITTIEKENKSNDEKREFDKKLKEAHISIESLISENKSLILKIQDLHNEITRLENENGTLSDELMEYVQEADNLDKHKNVKNVSINTSTILEKRLSMSPVKKNYLALISQIEDDLIKIFETTQIKYSVDNISTEKKIETFKTCIQECHSVIESIIKQQALNSEKIKNITEELELKDSKINEVIYNSDQLDTQLKNLIDENKEIKSNLENVSTKYDTLMQTESDLQKVNVQNQKEINLLNADIILMKSELDEMKQISDSKQKQIEDLKENIKFFDSELCSKNVTVISLENQIQSLNEMIVTLNSSCADTEMQLKTTLDSIDQKKSEINELVYELSKSKVTFENVCTKISDRDQRIIELENEVKRLEDVENKLCNKNESINQLENEISTLKNSVILHESYVIKKDKEIEILKQKLVSNESLLIKLESDTQSNARHKNTVELLEEQLKTMEQEKLLHEKEMQTLKTQKNQTMLQIEGFQIKIINLQQMIDTCKSENSAKDIKIKQMQDHLSSITGKFQQQSDLEMQKKSDLENQIASYQNEMITYQEKIQKYHSLISKSENSNEELKQILVTKQYEMHQLRQCMDKMTAELCDINQSKTVMSKRIEKLEDDCRLYISQIHSKSEDEFKLKEELKLSKTQKNLLECNVKSYQSENSHLNSKIEELNNRHKMQLEKKNDLEKREFTLESLKNEITNLKDAIDSKNNEITKMQLLTKSLTVQLEESISKESTLMNCLNKAQNEKNEIEKKLEEESKANNEKKFGVNTEFMEYFVDKMTYEMEQEKNKQLQTVNNDLQSKNNNLFAEVRRLRHSLQDNTLSNLLPNDNKQANGQTELIDKLKVQLNQRDEHIKKLNALQHDEFNKFTNKLNKAENQCTDLYKENASLKARLANCELELSESKENSQIQERRRRRQSLHDMNRGCHSPMSNIENRNEKNIIDNKHTELEKENAILRKNISDLIFNNQELKNKFQSAPENILNNPNASRTHVCINCTNNDHVKREFEMVKARNRELELRLSSHAANKPIIQDHSGSGIVMGQKLCEYMAENKRLQEVNSKLKELCRMRDRKIKDLEKAM